MEQINGYFANARAIYWCAYTILTLLGGFLAAAGYRYYKRLLFVIGALPAYLGLHCLCCQFGWPEVWAIVVGLLAGLALVLLSWAYIVDHVKRIEIAIVCKIEHDF